MIAALLAACTWFIMSDYIAASRLYTLWPWRLLLCCYKFCFLKSREWKCPFIYILTELKYLAKCRVCCFVLAGDTFSFWSYLEKYLECFASLPCCVSAGKYSSQHKQWAVLTRLFHASVCCTLKHGKFSAQLLSELDSLSISASAVSKDCYVMKM